MLSIRFPDHQIILMTIYNPPGNDCSSFLAEKLAEFATRYENIFLVGDFNTDMLRPSVKLTQFKSMLFSHSLSPVSEEPTFSTVMDAHSLIFS